MLYIKSNCHICVKIQQNEKEKNPNINYKNTYRPFCCLYYLPNQCKWDSFVPLGTLKVVVDPQPRKKYGGSSYTTSAHSPQIHRTVTVTVRMITKFTGTLINILSQITYFAASIRISKHINRTTDVIFELITKI